MKNTVQITFINITLFFSLAVKAQVYYDEKTGEEYEINQNSDQKIIKAFLEEQKATAIEFNPNESKFPFRVKNKKGNWVLYGEYLNNIGKVELTPILQKWAKKYSFHFPQKITNEDLIFIIDRNEKKYLYPHFTNKKQAKINKKLWFDELTVIPHTDTNTIEIFDENGELENVKETEVSYMSIVLRRKNSHALADLSYDAEIPVYQLSGFHFNSKDSLPSINSFYNINASSTNSYSQKLDVMRATHKALMEHPEYDIIFPFSVELNQLNTILKARDFESKRWSILVPNQLNEIDAFPISANSIRQHQKHENHKNHVSDGSILEVWSENNVGYYYYNGNTVQQVLPCEYDDFKYISIQEVTYDKADTPIGTDKKIYGCALKKNEKWELYMLDAPMKIIAGKANSIKELKELWQNSLKKN